MTFTEFLLLISGIFNFVFLYIVYLYANPIDSKKRQLWVLTRNIVEKFQNQIIHQGKLPVSQDVHDCSKELIYEVENKLCSKGYKVSTRNNVITIE